MAAQQMGGLETHDDRRELGEPRVEPQRAAAADDRGRDRQPDERRSDEKQFLAMPLTRAARRGAVGEDEPARNHPVDEDARAIAGRRRRHRRQSRVERSEEHTSELQSLMRISYAVFCLKKKNTNNI